VKKTLLLAAAAATLLWIGCSSAHLFPVAGPISSQNTSSLSASLTNIPAGHGKLKVVMPDGEVVEGTYSTSDDTNWSPGKGAAAEGGVAIAPSDWAAVFDPAPSVAKLQRGQANATGTKGTILSIEFAVNGGSGKAFGVGKDNRGNLYRFEIEGLPSGTGPSQNAVPPEPPPRRGKA
jgi:hypothetical protein